MRAPAPETDEWRLVEPAIVVTIIVVYLVFLHPLASPWNEWRWLGWVLAPFFLFSPVVLLLSWIAVAINAARLVFAGERGRSARLLLGWGLVATAPAWGDWPFPSA